jgi:hypothetical protein
MVQGLYYRYLGEERRLYNYTWGNGMANKRTIEIFSAGCPACTETIEEIKKNSCPSCEITVHDMNDVGVAACARSLGIRSVGRY